MAGVQPARPEDLAVPPDIGSVAAPRYGSRSLADLLPAVVAHCLGRDTSHHPLAADLTGDRVVVLVVDGLGSRQLARVDGLAPTLRSLPGGSVDAVFPTTTVASIASVGTGRPPSQHGLVGYAFPVPGHDQPLGALGWRIGLRGGGFDARDVVVPEDVQPEATMFERATAAGIDTTVVLHPEFLDSGLTRAALRGGVVRPAPGLDEGLGVAVEAVAAADGPALAYVHHGAVDHVGHRTGPCTEAWCDAVAAVDRVLAAWQRRLPRGVTIVVTADHGMLDVPDPEVVELADHPDLLDGVRVLAGEPRVRHLALHEDAVVEEVATRWRARLGDRVLVAARDEAMRLFGPGPTAAARRHIGDLVVLARRGSLVHRRVDPHEGRHRGQHGGPSRAERRVPLRHLTRTA